MSEADEWDIECVHEKTNSISPSVHLLFCLLYKHANNDVFDDFPKISEHFPKISEDFPKLFQGLSNISEHFPNIFRRLPKVAEDFRGSTDDVSIIQHHLWVLFKKSGNPLKVYCNMTTDGGKLRIMIWVSYERTNFLKYMYLINQVRGPYWETIGPRSWQYGPSAARSVRKRLRADILPVRSRASLVNKRFITRLKKAKTCKDTSAGSFGTMPGPILREYRTGNRAFWLADFSYWPSDCLSRVIIGSSAQRTHSFPPQLYVIKWDQLYRRLLCTLLFVPTNLFVNFFLFVIKANIVPNCFYFFTWPMNFVLFEEAGFLSPTLCLTAHPPHHSCQ